eukprot:PhF_6_TR35161/c0_g1_i1/m.51229/K19054/FXN; frataxin
MRRSFRYLCAAGGMSGFTNVEYNTIAENTLERIYDVCDELAERLPDKVTEVANDGGVLQIDTIGGKFVLNKQAPNLQLWLSSPVTGPFHYDLHKSNSGGAEAAKWLCQRDKHDIFQKLTEDLSEILKPD